MCTVGLKCIHKKVITAHWTVNYHNILYGKIKKDMCFTMQLFVGWHAVYVCNIKQNQFRTAYLQIIICETLTLILQTGFISHGFAFLILTLYITSWLMTIQKTRQGNKARNGSCLIIGYILGYHLQFNYVTGHQGVGQLLGVLGRVEGISGYTGLLELPHGVITTGQKPFWCP